MGQVVDFLTCSRHPAERFPLALNYFLPEDVKVRKALEVSLDFNARRSANSRVYQYRVLAREEPTALLRHSHYWMRGSLNVQRMAEAAMALIGTHDFRIIASGHPKDRSAIRTVLRWDVRQEGETVVIESEAHGFLKQQIRKTNAILLEIGKDKRPIELMRQTLERADGGPNIALLPAHGLCLMQVKYPEGTFDSPPWET